MGGLLQERVCSLFACVAHHLQAHQLAAAAASGVRRHCPATAAGLCLPALDFPELPRVPDPTRPPAHALHPAPCNPTRPPGALGLPRRGLGRGAAAGAALDPGHARGGVGWVTLLLIAGCCCLLLAAAAYCWLLLIRGRWHPTKDTTADSPLLGVINTACCCCPCCCACALQSSPMPSTCTPCCCRCCKSCRGAAPASTC